MIGKKMKKVSVERIFEVIADKIYAVENPNSSLPSSWDRGLIIEELKRSAVYEESKIRFVNLPYDIEKARKARENLPKISVYPILVLGRYILYDNNRKDFVFVKDGDWFVEGFNTLSELQRAIDDYARSSERVYIYNYYLLTDCIYESAYPDYYIGESKEKLKKDSNEEYFLRFSDEDTPCAYAMTLNNVVDVKYKSKHYLMYCSSMAEIYNSIGDILVSKNEEDGTVYKGTFSYNLKEYSFNIKFNKEIVLEIFDKDGVLIDAFA